MENWQAGRETKTEVYSSEPGHGSTKGEGPTRAQRLPRFPGLPHPRSGRKEGPRQRGRLACSQLAGPSALLTTAVPTVNPRGRAAEAEERGQEEGCPAWGSVFPGTSPKQS